MRKLYKYRIAGLIIIWLFVCIFSKDVTALGGSDSGRLAAAGEIGTKGIFAISASPLRSSDRVIFNGEKYSDKPLFLPWCAGLFYRVWHNFSGWNMENNTSGSIKLLTTVLNILVNSLLFWWFFNLLRRIKYGSMSTKFLLSLLLIFSTWIGSYSTVFMHHNLTALAVLGLWISLVKFSKKTTIKAAFSAGICAGLAGVVELPMGLFCGTTALLAILIVSIKKKENYLRLCSIAAAGGCMMLLCLLLLNYYAYKDFRFLYIVPGGSYVPPQGWKDGVWIYAFDCLFWTRGIFSYQIFLLLALPGWLMWRKKLSAGLKILSIIPVMMMIFYFAFTNEYGGWSYGFRYFIPMIPLLYLWASYGVLKISRKWYSCTASVFLLCGTITSMVGAVSPNCVAYEGIHSADGHFTHAIQSTFIGNTLEIVQRFAPDSAAMVFFEEHYGADNVREFCFWQAVNIDRQDLRLGIKSRDEALKQFKKPANRE